MPDDKNRTRPHDSSRVNVNEEYEVRYWSQKFGVSPYRLKDAVHKVGPMPKNVQRELTDSRK